MPIRNHDVEDLSEHEHDLSESTVAHLELPVGQVDALEEGADLEEEL